MSTTPGDGSQSPLCFVTTRDGEETVEGPRFPRLYPPTKGIALGREGGELSGPKLRVWRSERVRGLRTLVRMETKKGVVRKTGTKTEK